MSSTYAAISKANNGLIDTNDNMYSTATNLSGPWSEWATFADEGSNTYNSQTTFVFGVGDTVM